MIKTVSLETAKLLKENGFRQDTEKVWLKLGAQDGFCLADKDFLDIHYGNEWYAAPTTDELLEELPDGVRIYKSQGEFNIFLTNAMPPFISHKILPEALSILWLYLKKEVLNGRS